MWQDLSPEPTRQPRHNSQARGRASKRAGCRASSWGTLRGQRLPTAHGKAADPRLGFILCRQEAEARCAGRLEGQEHCREKGVKPLAVELWGEYSARRLSRPVGRNESQLSSLHRGQERRCVNKDRRLPSEPMGNSGGLATVDCQNGSQPSARDQPSPGRW